MSNLEPSRNATPDIARLILAADNNDGRAVLSHITEISAAVGPIALITRLLQLINSQGRATYDMDWPHILTDTIDTLDIDAFGIARPPKPPPLEHMDPETFKETFDPDD